MSGSQRKSARTFVALNTSLFTVGSFVKRRGADSKDAGTYQSGRVERYFAASGSEPERCAVCFNGEEPKKGAKPLANGEIQMVAATKSQIVPCTKLEKVSGNGIERIESAPERQDSIGLKPGLIKAGFTRQLRTIVYLV